MKKRLSFSLFALILGACAPDPREVVANLPSRAPTTPHPNSIAAQLAGDWLRPPNTSDKQMDMDKAGCRSFAALVPDGAGTPGLRADVAYLNCLKAKGYTPIPPQGRS